MLFLESWSRLEESDVILLDVLQNMARERLLKPVNLKLTMQNN